MKNLLKALSLLMGTSLLESLLRAHPDIAYVSVTKSKEISGIYSEQELCD